METSLLLKTKDLIHRDSRIPFAKEMDLYSVEEGILIGVTGALGLGFRFTGKDLLLQSDPEIEDFERRAAKFLNALPEGVMLHFVVHSQSGDEETLRAYQSSIEIQDELTARLVDSRISSFRRNPLLKREVFLFVVIHPYGKKSPSSFIPDFSIAFGKKARKLSHLEFEKAKEVLERVSRDVQEGLQSLGFILKPLEKDETLRLLYEFLNPSSKLVPYEEKRFARERRFLSSTSSLRSRLLAHPPVMGERFFYLDGFFHKALNLLEAPEECEVKSFKDFERELGKDYFLSLTLQVSDQEKEKSRVQFQGNLSKAEAYYSKTKQHEAIRKVDESDELLEELAKTGEKLFYVWLTVLVRSKTREEADGKALDSLRIFPRLGGALGIEDHMNHDRLFLSFLPLQGDDNALWHVVKTDMLVNLLPLQASWPGTERFGLLLKTYRDEPLRLDLFDPRLPAKHGVMLGSTGSGKSFFTTHLLLHFLIESLKHEVIVIDVGGSYRKLCEVLGGSYLEVECSEAYALNPFPRKEILFPNEREADSTFLSFLKGLLQKMIAPQRIWPASEVMLLERAIREAYRNLEKDRSPILGDIEVILRDFGLGDDEDREKARHFAKELALFTQGEYGKILNRRGGFDFNSRFTVFDLRKISHYPELQEILLLIIPFALKRKFENVSIEKLLILDECWQLLKESQGTELVEVFYRTARKMNAGVLSITQNPEDFLEARIASSIINNSPVKYILRLKKGHEKLSLFSLNENEIQAVQELEVRPGYFSEVFIKFDDRSVVSKLEPSPLDYWIATTDAQDLAEEKKLKEGERITGLKALERLAHQFPHGAKKSHEASHGK